jgi:hypothetical protein
MARPLYGEGKLALMASACADFAAGANLAALRQVPSQGVAILIIDVLVGIRAEGANAANRRSESSSASTRRIAVAPTLGTPVRARRSVSETVAHGTTWRPRGFGSLCGWRDGRFWIVHFLI